MNFEMKKDNNAYTIFRDLDIDRKEWYESGQKKSMKYFKDGKESAGLLAQDVEKIMPSAVSERKLPLHADDDKSYKTLHYDSMTAILVEAIKELSSKLEESTKRIETLENR